jgi:hypothetical protein
VYGTATSADGFLVLPTVSSFSPKRGPVGTIVAITGSAFTGAISVLFNGVPASFTVDSYSGITATVPAAATTGRIRVKTPGGIYRTSSIFTVT